MTNKERLKNLHADNRLMGTRPHPIRPHPIRSVHDLFQWCNVMDNHITLKLKDKRKIYEKSVKQNAN